MQILEYLAMLEPQTSGYLSQMQGVAPKRTASEKAFADAMKKAGRAKACPACRGRQGKHDDDKFIWCARCNGSGKRADTGGMKDSHRNKSSEAVEAHDVAAWLVGLPAKKVDAALVYVNSNDAARGRLESEVFRLAFIKSRSWGKNTTDIDKKLAGFTALTIRELQMPVDKFIKTGEYCNRLGISRQQWHTIWAPVHWDIYGDVANWVGDVGQGMRRNRYGKRAA